MKVTAIEIKHHQSKNTLKKLNYILQISQINLKESDTWEIQLTLEINFIFCEDIDNNQSVITR